MNNIINLVHYYILKRKKFEEIIALLNIKDEELIGYINEINNSNNQEIPVEIIDDKPKIIYHKIAFKTHYLSCKRNKIKIMLVSDKHIDHLDDRIDYINRVYEVAELRNIDYIFDLGDILNGPESKVHNKQKVRTGTLEGSMEQLIKYHCFNIPTYFTTGNHDIKFMLNDLCDIGKLIESECKNMIFLNNLFTSIDINGFRINLTHGSIENTYLTNINLHQNFNFLTNNDPHAICQGHFHISSSFDKFAPFLYLIPSLKSGNTSIKNKKKVDIHASGRTDIGAVFLTIHELSEEFEVLYEKLEFIEKEQILKSEKRIRKRINY